MQKPISSLLEDYVIFLKVDMTILDANIKH